MIDLENQNQEYTTALRFAVVIFTMSSLIKCKTIKDQELRERV